MMTKINMKALLGCYMATVVKEAIESGELTWTNITDWAIKENMGIADKRFIYEVTALVEYYAQHWKK